MTNETPPQMAVNVEQCDIDLYKQLLSIASDNYDRRADGVPIVSPIELLARHRLQALAEPATGGDLEVLGEKLFALSDHLRRSGVLSDAGTHIAYEDVVAEFQRLSAAPLAQPSQIREVRTDTKHSSHETRFSDASSFDEVCVKCGATDIAGGGWGNLALPCAAAPKAPAPSDAREIADHYGYPLSEAGIARLDAALEPAPSDGVLHKGFGEALIPLAELLDGPSKGEFYGIGQTLRAKLDTIRLTLSYAIDDATSAKEALANPAGEGGVRARALELVMEMADWVTPDDSEVYKWIDEAKRIAALSANGGEAG